MKRKLKIVVFVACSIAVKPLKPLNLFLKVFPSIATYRLLRLISRNFTTRFGSHWWRKNWQMRQMKLTQLVLGCAL